jgi:hypothetical protein
LDGITHVVDGRTKTGGDKRRKITLAELEARARLSDETKRVSDELRASRTDENIAASIPGREGAGRDVLAYIAEMERRIIAARAPVASNFYRESLALELASRRSTDKPKRSTSTAKSVTAAQSREIAAAALSLIGLNYPKTPAEADALLAELAVSVPA